MKIVTLFIFLVLFGCSDNVDKWIKPKDTIVYIQESDLKPSTPKIIGHVKFLKDLSSNGKYKLGYKFNIETESLDTKKIPKKYLGGEQITIGSTQYTTIPITVSSYTSNFIFTLKDKDGFEVNTFVSKDFSINVNTNGKTELNVIQDNVGELSLEEVNNVKIIEMTLHIGECLSCK
jgi:hypothetical protein